jgi:hypothetical protein
MLFNLFTYQSVMHGYRKIQTDKKIDATMKSFFNYGKIAMSKHDLGTDPMDTVDVGEQKTARPQNSPIRRVIGASTDLVNFVVDRIHDEETTADDLTIYGTRMAVEGLRLLSMPRSPQTNRLRFELNQAGALLKTWTGLAYDVVDGRRAAGGHGSEIGPYLDAMTDRYRDIRGTAAIKEQALLVFQESNIGGSKDSFWRDAMRSMSLPSIGRAWAEYNGFVVPENAKGSSFSRNRVIISLASAVARENPRRVHAILHDLSSNNLDLAIDRLNAKTWTRMAGSEDEVEANKQKAVIRMNALLSVTTRQLKVVDPDFDPKKWKQWVQLDAGFDINSIPQLDETQQGLVDKVMEKIEEIDTPQTDN